MKVVATAPLPGPALEILGRRHEVVVLPEVRRDELLALAPAHRDAAGLLPLLTVRVDGEVMDAFPALRVIGNYAVGVDNIDLGAARARGVTVCNTPDVLTDATADLAFALILATARRVVEADGFVRAGQWRSFSPTLMLGADVAGATLGLVGFGRIGQAVARRAAGFGMRVLYAGPREVAHPTATRATIDALLAESDFVSLHCPLNDATRGLIDARALARMKPTARLINTARGAVVDEDALAQALREGRIAGAGLDVFRDEPHPSPAILSAPGTVLLPHIGSASRGSREAMAARAAEGIADVLAGVAPRFRVV